MQSVLTHRPMATRGLTVAAALLIILAGVVHLRIAPQHWEHAPAHSLFFALSGVAQVAWGIAYIKRPSAALCRTGLVLTVGLIALYVVTRLLPAPTADEPESFNAASVGSKLPEVFGLLVLAYLASSGTSYAKAAWRTVVSLVAFGAVAGLLTYGAAKAAEPVLGPLGLAGAHEHGEEVAGSGVSPEGTGPSARALPAAEQIQLVVAGFAAPIASTDNVPVAGDVSARLSLSRAGAGRFGRTLEVFLTRAGAPAGPVEGAAIRGAGHMRYMDHGAFTAVAVPADGSRYLVLLPFIMPGEWEVQLDIAAAGAKGQLLLDLDVF